MPTVDTVETVYDHLDFVHALNVFLDGYAGASTYAARRASTRSACPTTRS